MSLELLLAPQLEAVLRLGGEAIGVSAPGPFVDKIVARGVRHVALESSTRRANLAADLRTMMQFWRVVRRERPTVLHTHNPKPGLYGRVLGRLAGVPIVVNTVHGLIATPDDPPAKRALVYVLEAVASRFSDAELVQNVEDVELMRRLHLVPADHLQLLGNGIDVARFAADRPTARSALRSEWGVPDDVVLIGAVGRLVAEKGYRELFEAAARLRNARVVVIGDTDPEKADSLTRSEIEAALSVGVTVAGFRTDMDDVYRALDVFTLPSHREGFPRAAMEAAAAGLPLVVTDIRGCRQVVEHGVNGLRVPARDAGRLATALQQLIDDPGLRERYATQSRLRAAQEFNEQSVVHKVLACYAEIARQKAITLTPPLTDAAVAVTTTGSLPPATD